MNIEILNDQSIVEFVSEVDRHGKLISPLSEYSDNNFRLDGLKKLQSVGASIPSPIFVVTHESFQFFKENPEAFLKAIEEELGAIPEQLAKRSNKKSIALRRAYMVPNLSKPGEFLSNPEGPRYLGKPPEELSKCIVALFLEAIKRGYDIPNAKIAGFFYPFADPDNKPLGEIEEGDKLPFGGHIIIDGPVFKIQVTWGNNETVIYQEDNGIPIETYELAVDENDYSKINILNKQVVPKYIMHYTSKNGKSEMVTVPLSHQLQPILHDSDIVDLVRDLKPLELLKRYGPQRVEFSSNGDSVLFNESTNFENEYEEQEEKTIMISGKVFKVASPNDVVRLSRFNREQLKSVIPYYVDRNRDSETGSLLVKQFSGSQLTVLIAGKNNVSHDAKIFSDAKFSPIAIGKQNLDEGDEVIVRVENGSVEIENRAIDSITEAVPLFCAHKRGLAKVGGKAERLSILREAGFFVPNGVVLTTEFFDQVINTDVVGRVWRKLQEGVSKDVLPEVLGEIPENVWGKVSPLLARFGLFEGQKNIIARSSANIEDVRGRSFAGRFMSVPFVKGEEMIQQAVLECLRSCYSSRVLSYVEESPQQFLSKVKLAIIIQEMVDAAISGVLFAGDISTGSTKRIVIEAKQGFANEIVEGQGYEEKLLINKRERNIEKQHGVDLLTATQVNYLVSLSERLEKMFGYPQDIEWSFDKSGKFWIVQSRDL